MAKLTLFDAAFLVILAAATLTNFLTESFSMAYAAPYCFCLILYIYARKDLKDRIIPPSWWLVCIPLCALGLFSAASPAVLIASVVLGELYFILGYIGPLNGADALAMASMSCIYAGITIAGVPVGIFILLATCILGLAMMACIPEWRRGMPALVPCCLICTLALAV